jgi:hypothetical protein
MTAHEFEVYRNTAKRILGYMPIKTACVTCQTPDSQIPKGTKLPSRNCLIRQCVDKAGIRNCAYCSRFPCDSVEATSGLWNRRNIEEKLGAPLSKEEYHAFIEPFEGLRRLEVIRASLKPSEIVQPANVKPIETEIVGLPEKLCVPEEEKTAFRAVHKLLADIRRSPLGLRDTDTFAQQHKLENRRSHVLRFLWILGCFGKFEKDNGACLVVDAKSYEANRSSEKTLAIWAFVKDTVFKVLSEFGIRCERVALEGAKEEDLATGTGYLRSRGWVMKMSFEPKIGGSTTLKALQTYARKLNEKHGKKAFQPFSIVDMSVMLEN